MSSLTSTPLRRPEPAPTPDPLAEAKSALAQIKTRGPTWLRAHRAWLLPLAPLLLALWLPLHWCWNRWVAPDSPQSYQPLVPLAAAWLAWARRDTLARVPRVVGEGVFGGLGLVFLGCVLLLLGHASQLVTLPMLGAVVVLAGTVRYLYGRTMLRALAVPLLFLLLTVPLPDRILGGWTQSLQMGCTQGAGHVLSNLGYENAVAGNLIFLHGFQLDVIAPCSGVSILFPVIVMTLWLLLLRRAGPVKIIPALAIAAVIALLMNVLRIASIGMLGTAHPRLAHTLHDPISWLWTALAFEVSSLFARPPKVSRP